MSYTVIEKGEDPAHRCEMPQSHINHNIGTIIECNECGKRHVLVSKLWSGLVWAAVKGK